MENRRNISATALRCPWTQMLQDNLTLCFLTLLTEKVGKPIVKRWVARKKFSTTALTPTWKAENYTIYYYDSEPWDSAAQYAYEYDWSAAMKLWMNTLNTKNPEKRSCAEFNIATACYMLGDLDLALRWLNQSDKDDKKPSSATLRKRIEERKAR